MLLGPGDQLIAVVQSWASPHLTEAVQLLEEGNFDEAIRLANGGGEGIQGLRHIVCLKCLGKVKQSSLCAAALFSGHCSLGLLR